MSVRAVRLVVLAICVLAVAGMIVTSILDHIGAAITFGLISAAAILCSMVATAVSTTAASTTGPRPPAALDETQAALVEDMVQQLVEAGADERQIRGLVGEAVRLGRGGA